MILVGFCVFVMMIEEVDVVVFVFEWFDFVFDELIEDGEVFGEFGGDVEI